MYNVGDILWIVSNDRPGVLPYSVVEEVTKKTIQGIETAYFVESSSNNRKSKLDTINGEIYNSVEEAKAALMQKAEQAIDKMLSVGKGLIEKNLDEQSIMENFESSETTKPTKTKEKNIVEEETVVLPDGSKAKVNIIGDLP